MAADVTPAMRRQGVINPLLVAAVFALSIGVAHVSARRPANGHGYWHRRRPRRQPPFPGLIQIAALTRRGKAGQEQTMTERLVTSAKRDTDATEASLRPQTLAEFIGQEQARANLSIFIQAARDRGEALDHVLFAGPPGLGKTTLAQIMAKELGVGFRATSGPVIAKAGDLAALLTNLEDRDVLFIDEIHRLSPAIEEILYPALEDYQLDLIIGEGPAARSVRIDLAKFTLVGATTRLGLLTTPLRDRFGIPVRLNFYTVEELERVVTRGARVLGAPISPDGAHEIARRARGTPRIAGRLLRRVRDFASVGGAPIIDATLADKALTALEVDAEGLDSLDRRYLGCIAKTPRRRARSASRPSPPRCPSRAMRWRRSSSRICCSRASSAARRADASRRSRPTSISACRGRSARRARKAPYSTC